MWMPALLGENLIDDFFDEFFEDWNGRTRYPDERQGNKNPKPAYGAQPEHLMRTDIKETPEEYILTVDLPGFKKEEIQIAVENDCLTISAQKEQEKEDMCYLRRERYAGSLRRAFYVGEGVEQEGMKAQFRNGVLLLTLPKQKPQKVVEENKYIAIE